MITYLIIASLIGGTWIFADGIASLWAYMPNKKETWLRNHLLRVVRCVVGLAFIVLGVLGVLAL